MHRNPVLLLLCIGLAIGVLTPSVPGRDESYPESETALRGWLAQMAKVKPFESTRADVEQVFGQLLGPDELAQGLMADAKVVAFFVGPKTKFENRPTPEALMGRLVEIDVFPHKPIHLDEKRLRARSEPEETTDAGIKYRIYEGSRGMGFWVFASKDGDFRPGDLYMIGYGPTSDEIRHALG